MTDIKPNSKTVEAPINQQLNFQEKLSAEQEAYIRSLMRLQIAAFLEELKQS